MKTHSVKREKLFLEYVKAEIDSKFAPDFKIKFSPDEGKGIDRTKYYLIHFSNHPRAMLIMKQIMHGLGDEVGTFDYSATKQGILFSKKPKLSELKEYLINKYAGGNIKINFLDLQIETSDLPYIEKEYRKAIKEMEGTSLDIERIESKETGLKDKDIIVFK